MSKFFVVLQREYAQLVKKKSFLIMTLLTPIMMVAFMFVPAFIARRGVVETEAYAIVDQDGHNVGSDLTEAMTSYTLNEDTTPAYKLEALRQFETQDSVGSRGAVDTLVQSIREGYLDYLLVLLPDPHVSDSNLLLITNSDNFRTIDRFESKLSQVLAKRRLEISQINLPVDSVMALTKRIDLPRQDTKGETVRSEIKFMVGIVLLLLIYMLILIDGQALMQSVIDEKTDRIVEVLVSSVTPFQLMAGKIIGTGLAALTQVGIWILGGFGIVMFSSFTGTEIDSAIMRTAFNPATIVSFVMFLVLGYLLYSTFFALIGSIVNSPKEAQPILLPVILLLFAPSLMIGFAVLESPNAGWIRVMSFIPTYTPLLMMMRVAVVAPTVEGNPLLSPIMGEAVLGMLGIIVGIIISVWITSRVFRIGILMYGKRPTLPEIMRWVRHK
jgi:ABC-2 type transport system permease protein